MADVNLKCLWFPENNNKLKCDITMEKHDLKDVFLEIMDTINEDPAVAMIKDTFLTGVEALSLGVGAAIGFGNGLLINYDIWKLKHLILGLSRDLDVEKQINELYNYVHSSSRIARYVGNILKETLAAESPKSCVVLGVALSNLLKQNRDISRNELIACRALEVANDYDLEYFDLIMKNHISKKNGRRTVLYDTNTIQQGEIEDYDLTCAWCASYRLFSTTIMEQTQMDSVMSELPSYYFVEKPADNLFDLLADVSQIMKYENG